MALISRYRKPSNKRSKKPIELDLSHVPRYLNNGDVSNLDPHKFYEDNHAIAVANSAGVERLVFASIPKSLLMSTALAIDPLRKFRALAGKTTAVNRTRKRSSMNVAQGRTSPQDCPTISGQTFPIGGACYTPYQYNKSPVGGTWVFANQGPIISTTKDTTRRTRPIGSDRGEFEHFKLSFSSPGLTVSKRIFTESRVYFSGCPTTFQGTSNDRPWTQWFSGPSVRSLDTNAELIRLDELSYASGLILSQTPGMVKSILPTSRRLSIFRDVAELKDLPRSIRQLQRTVQNLARAFDVLTTSSNLRRLHAYVGRSLDDVPKEYVSYNFGWKQIFSVIQDLTSKPEMIAKQIRYLQLRSGLPTTHKLLRKYSSKPGASPTFSTDRLVNVETIPTLAFSSKRTTELKMVVNSTFDFPPVELPKFRENLMLQKLGLYPTYTDLYNLTPWSWLIDWFTGLGNYVALMDVINTDPALINWGFITAKSRGEYSVVRKSISTSTTSRTYNGVNSSQTLNKSNVSVSTLHYDFQLRKAIGGAHGVKTLEEQTSLTSYQQSILGALLAMRTPIRARP